MPADIISKYRGKRIDNGKWVYGAFFGGEKWNLLITSLRDTDCINKYSLCEAYEIDPATVGRFTGHTDIEGNELYQGDVITGLNGISMVIRYGDYEAFCPADKAYMRSVGFYAEAKGYPQMPIGPTEEYAEKIGNIYDNPKFKKE